MSLTDEQRRAWEENGYFLVRGHFTPDMVKKIYERVAAVAERFFEMKKRGEKPPTQFLIEQDVLEETFEPQTPLEAIRKIGHVTAYDEELQEVFGRYPKSVEMLRDMLGGGIRAVMGALFAKPAGRGSETPWHQDQGLWGYPLPTAVSIWTSLDPCTRENGCLQFWRGSHRAGTKEHIFLEGAIHKHLREEDVIRDEVEYIEMVPGDAVFFGGNVWHKSDPNTSRQRRLGVVAVYANHDEFESGIANSDWNPRRHAYWVCRET